MGYRLNCVPSHSRVLAFPVLLQYSRIKPNYYNFYYNFTGLRQILLGDFAASNIKLVEEEGRSTVFEQCLQRIFFTLLHQHHNIN